MKREEKDKNLLNSMDIFSLGFAGTIGSGIFVMLGLGIGYTGKSIVLAILLGCMIMMGCYFYNIALSSMFVFDGGDYQMKALLFSTVPAGVSAMFNFFDGFAMTAYATAMVDYLSSIFPGIAPFKDISAIIIITVFFAISIKGSKIVAHVENAMTYILLAAIALFIIVGVPKIQPGYVSPDFFTRLSGADYGAGGGDECDEEPEEGDSKDDICQYGGGGGCVQSDGLCGGRGASC